VQQAVLYSASASLDNAGDDRMTTCIRTPHGRRRRRPNDDNNDKDLLCRPLMLQHPLILLSLPSPLGAQFIRSKLNTMNYSKTWKVAYLMWWWWHVPLVHQKDCTQTKRKWHCPWCEDDTCALGWGVVMY